MSLYEDFGPIPMLLLNDTQKSALRSDIEAMRQAESGEDQKMAESEVRETDPQTGGQKGRKLEELGAIDPLALMELAKVAGFGGKKYARSNYLKGYRWSLSYDALQRHAAAFWSGENIDPESKCRHAAAVAWHALALVSFEMHNLGTDDRWIAPKPERVGEFEN